MLDNRKRLLVVEDHLDTLKMMNCLLTAKAFIVDGAADGARAMELAALHSYDLAIVDIGLPDIDGCDLMKKIRDQYDIEGLAITELGRKNDVERCLAAGFSQHLLKPIDVETLLHTIARLISG